MPTPSSKEFNTHWHLFSFFLSLIFLDKFSIANYDAQTRQNGCCTCIWLGNARATLLPTRWCCVWVFVCLFAFFFFLNGFAPTQLQFTPIPAKSVYSARIRSYRLNRIVSVGSRNWPKWSKSALNHAETAEINFEWGSNILNLSFLNFILNICCFFCVLCFLPSSFFVVWTKDI